MLLLRKNKKFITIMIALIIIVLLFSVVAIVALYTTPQQTYQIPVDSINTNIVPEGWLQWNTFTVWEENIVEETENEVLEQPVEASDNIDEIISPNEENVQDETWDSIE